MQSHLEFISVNRAAEILGISTQSIRTMIWNKQLAGVRVGRRGWCIPAAELTRFNERAFSGADLVKRASDEPPR
jgi:excisionase family DNA binding protein